MMSNPSPEYLTAAEVAKTHRVSAQTVYRWAQVGCPIGGRVVRLDNVAAGNRYLFTPAAVEKFVAECTAAREAAASATFAGDRPPRPTNDDEERLARLMARLRPRGPRSPLQDDDDGYAEAMAACGRPVMREAVPAKMSNTKRPRNR